MTRISDQTIATLEFILDWQCLEAAHRERFLARKVNPWRDIFPPGLHEELTGLEAGQSAKMEYAPGQAIRDYDPSLVFHLPESAFSISSLNGRGIVPRDGRYYPRGLFAGLSGVFPQDTRPARVLQAGPDGLVVDLNHPLAGRATSLTARVDSVTPKRSDTGGRLSHWLEEMADFGPGMQARRCVGVPTDFSGTEGPARLDETDDALFYSKARLIGHVDSQASKNLCDIYSKRLQPGDKVLDLMSSMQSHLGSEPDLMVTGLGMNAEELEANPVLARRTVRDVNASPSLPYSDGEFDAVVSSLSIEYLIDPRAVVHECARVLRSGGRFMVGFSNRWFPTKANFLWLDLHEYERVSLVLDYLLESGCFKDLWTESVRNWWRPADDPHVRQTWISDPVYVVGGTRA